MELKEIILRLVLSSIFGGIIGLERELKNKSAGFVTMILVCLGATTIALIQEELLLRQLIIAESHPEISNAVNLDLARLSAQVITGVGFIGGGAIIYNKDKIQGITTAAVLWVTAAIGLAVGYGFIFLSISTFTIVFITLIIMKSIEQRIIFKFKKKIMEKISEKE
nr:MgtC/SapB family protein [uncultured Cetobacterium sp.]